MANNSAQKPVLASPLGLPKGLWLPHDWQARDLLEVAPPRPSKLKGGALIVQSSYLFRGVGGWATARYVDALEELRTADYRFAARRFSAAFSASERTIGSVEKLCTLAATDPRGL